MSKSEIIGRMDDAIAEFVTQTGKPAASLYLGFEEYSEFLALSEIRFTFHACAGPSNQMSYRGVPIFRVYSKTHLGVGTLL